MFRSPLRLFGSGGKPEREKLMAGGGEEGPSATQEGSGSSRGQTAGPSFSPVFIRDCRAPSYLLTCQSSLLEIRVVSHDVASSLAPPSSCLTKSDLYRVQGWPQDPLGGPCV